MRAGSLSSFYTSYLPSVPSVRSVSLETSWKHGPQFKLKFSLFLSSAKANNINTRLGPYKVEIYCNVVIQSYTILSYEHLKSSLLTPLKTIWNVQKTHLHKNVQKSSVEQGARDGNASDFDITD